MFRTLILAATTAAFVVGGAAAATEKRDHRTHHYFWVMPTARAVDNGCDQSQLADLLHDANLCSADQQTLVPSVPDRR
jgi:hypothetical protein